MKSYLNLGCGNRYDPDWTNVDINPHGSNVIRHDLSRGIPFPDDSFEVVYHAAVLEHLQREDALQFLRECRRVLRPEGTLRVGVPDLERICELYLEKLRKAAQDDDPIATSEYDWMMLELLDQMVREESGGLMCRLLSQDPLPNRDFVFERIGEEGRELVEALRAYSVKSSSTARASIRSSIRRALRGLRNMPKTGREWMLRMLLGKNDFRALRVGRFRLAGEVHHWMYDRLSLAHILIEAGFREPVRQSATTSRIPGWREFSLDTNPDGKVIKPDLLFMEATK